MVDGVTLAIFPVVKCGDTTLNGEALALSDAGRVGQDGRRRRRRRRLHLACGSRQSIEADDETAGNEWNWLPGEGKWHAKSSAGRNTMTSI